MRRRSVVSVVRTAVFYLVPFCICGGVVAKDAVAATQLLVGSYWENSVLRYDGTIGDFVGVFVPPGSGGLGHVGGMCIGPDGNLYVRSVHSNEVLRYDKDTGDFIDVFFSWNPDDSHYQSLVYGPDEKFYIFTNSGIQRYDGLTGAFVDVFINGGSSYFAFGPDGDIYSSGEYSVLRYSGTTGDLIGTFALNPHTELDGSLSVIFGPNGDMYVSHQKGGSVTQYDGTTGEFVRILVPPQDPHSWSNTIPIAFGPDGNLYQGTGNNVRRFDGVTGDFIDYFVTEGSGGLHGSESFLFIPEPVSVSFFISAGLTFLLHRRSKGSRAWHIV